MWLLGFLLLPLVIATERELKIDNYLVKITNDTLETVSVTGASPSNELNLSGLGIQNLVKSSFDNLSNLTRLNLANNSIVHLGDNVFSKLTKLEYLSLADNALSEVGVFYKPYAALRNLKILNLTNNHYLTDFRRHLFFGLPASCDIITRGINMRTINTLLFEPAPNGGRSPTFAIYGDNDGCGSRQTGYISGNGPEMSLPKDLRVKVCIENGTVKALDIIIADEILAIGCKEVTVFHYANELHIRRMGITGFAKGWYNLQNLPVMNIDFEGNAISRITPELLNDLPSSVRVVVLEMNKIERVEKGIIENAHLSALVLRSNRISVVEDGALEKLPKIENIFLDHNRLTDMNFVATLPTSLQQLYLGHNEITEIAAGALAKFDKLFNLELRNNKIKKLDGRSLNGLWSLEQLRLENNRLETIEAGTSRDLKALVLFDVSNNSIARVETGSFVGLENICTINFRNNKLSQFPKSAMTDLPRTLKNIWMDDNEIERLEAGSFATVPKYYLTLGNNKIREIERGTFDLPQLYRLDLSNNLLTEFDGDSFEGLPRLNSLLLGNNRIAKLKKAGKNLGSLQFLRIPDNPLKRLENGSLFGLLASVFVDIDVKNTPIELVQGGVFDDV